MNTVHDLCYSALPSGVRSRARAENELPCGSVQPNREDLLRSNRRSWLRSSSLSSCYLTGCRRCWKYSHQRCVRRPEALQYAHFTLQAVERVDDWWGLGQQARDMPILRARAVKMLCEHTSAAARPPSPWSIRSCSRMRQQLPVSIQLELLPYLHPSFVRGISQPTPWKAHEVMQMWKGSSERT